MLKSNILVSGYIGFDNFGDEAIFYCLSNHLKTIGANVKAICNNTSDVSEKYGVDTVYYKDFINIIKSVLKCDILISGGGSLLQNKTSNFSLYYYLSIIFLAKIFFKKVIIFAQGIEPIKGKINKLITKHILKSADYISVRDNNSFNLLKQNNITSTLVSDPVYSLLQDRKISLNKEGLVIQLRKTADITDDFLNILARAIALNCKSEKIYLLSLQDDYDKEICLKFKEKLEKLNINSKLISKTDVLEVIDFLNNVKYVISTRLHGIIVSNALKSKTFALIYDDKIKTVVDELNIENIDLKNYTEDEVLNKIRLYFNSKDNTKEYRKYLWDSFDEKIKEFRGINEKNIR